MSEKISEEMAKKIIDVLFKYTQHKKDAMFELRAAGLLEPEEDALEKARSIWNKLDPALQKKYPWAEFDQQIIQMHDAYESAITRLKASAWTREDARWYGEYCWQQGRKWNSDIQTPAEWLAQRRAGKGDGTT